MDSERLLLPVFPLPLVQFPGALTPLHIFEPRYRKMLRDVLAGDRTFGIIFQDQAESENATSIGCAVEVIDSNMLADGRSTILCRGTRRFRISEYVTGEPYLRAYVEYFEDQPSEENLTELMQRISSLLSEVMSLGNRLGESRPAEIQSIELPTEPELFSCILSAHINLHVREKQYLLEMVETRGRLEFALITLRRLGEEYEKRLLALEIAGRNGHHGPVEIE